jgi:hypothetical protein
VTGWDPSGLGSGTYPTAVDPEPQPPTELPRVTVFGDDPIPGNISRTGYLPGDTIGGPAVYEPVGHFVGDKYVHDYNPFPRPESPSVEHPLPSKVPDQNPASNATQQTTATATATATAIATALPAGALGTVTRAMNDVKLVPDGLDPRRAYVGTVVFPLQALQTGPHSLAEFTDLNGHITRMGSDTIFRPPVPLGIPYAPTPTPTPLWFPGYLP